MKRILKILMPIGVLAIGIVVVVGLFATKPKPEETPETARPLSLFVERAVRDSVRVDVMSEGEVSARTEIDLIAQVSGRVVSVSTQFSNGGRFEQQQTLLEIEDADYRVALINAEAEVARWQTILMQAEAEAEVARQQLEGLNPSELGLKKPQIAEARAGLLGAQANREQAQLNLDRTKISLPFAGRIREKYVDLGQFVSAGTPLARVFSTDVAEVRLPLSDSQLAGLGLPVGFVATPEQVIPVELSALVAGQQRNWSGQLVRVDPAFDPSTRLLFAVVEVIDPYGVSAQASAMPLAVGLYVQARIAGKEVMDAQVIPRSALRSGDQVYVVVDGALQIRRVDVEHSDDQQVLVSRGVEEGELVVVSPVRDPVDGMAVEALHRENPSALADGEQLVPDAQDRQS